MYIILFFTFMSDSLYSLPNACFSVANTLSIDSQYSFTSSFVTMLVPLKYVILSFLSYLYLNIPFPSLSVVYCKSVSFPSAFNSNKLSILIFNQTIDVGLVIKPSLLKIYCLYVNSLYFTSMYNPPFSSTFISSFVYFFVGLNASFRKSTIIFSASSYFFILSTVISLP